MVKILKQTSHTSYEIALTASVTQTQGQQPLTADTNVIITVSNNNDVVTLPPVTAGIIQRIINVGLNTLQIFPASGEDLGNGVDTSTTIAVNEVIVLIGISSTTWKSLSLAVVDISCKITKSGPQTIPNNVGTVLTWDSELYDTDTMHDNVTNNERITIKTAGKYSVTLQSEWESNGSGVRNLTINVNGSDAGFSRTDGEARSHGICHWVGDLAVNDIITAIGFQNRGGNLDFEEGVTISNTYFEAHKIS